MRQVLPEICPSEKAAVMFRSLLVVLLVVAVTAAGCPKKLKPPPEEPIPPKTGVHEPPPKENGAPPNITIPAALALNPATVARGYTYEATASWFWPSEQVNFSWTGPSSGVITTVTADLTGQAGTTVEEYAAPGQYLITARGLTSGRTASAALQVVNP